MQTCTSITRTLCLWCCASAGSRQHACPFEHDANFFRELCPWANDHSPRSRALFDRDGNKREADIMCYVQGDTLGPCVSLQVMALVLLRAASAMPNLKRLSAAGRLLIIVLDKSQAPSTYFQRTMAAHYERLNVQNERLQDAIDDAHWQLRGCIASQSR